jgi:putative SOS response-associated peptidase YedK
MCGRYTLTSTEDIAARFGLGALAETRIEPRFNVSPLQHVPAIRSTSDGPMLEYMQWGFQPHWRPGQEQAPTPYQRAGRVAAGAADVQGRDQLRPLPDPRRWFLRVEGNPRPEGEAADAHPPEGRRVVRIRGLWTWGGDEVGPTCAIITTAPNELVATIHDRMTVILTEHGERLWLDRGTPCRAALSVLSPYPADL